MRFFDFEKRMSENPIFTSKELKSIFFEEKNILVQVAFWGKKGYVAKLRKGVYVLSRSAHGIDPMAVSAKLYAPSYISMEYALNYHGIIPDAPFTCTAVTTRKTEVFENTFGQFSYRHIKSELFNGYGAEKKNGVSVYIATPEKALFDFMYFNASRLDAKPQFWKEMRIDEEYDFNEDAFRQYKKIAPNASVEELLESFIQYRKHYA